MKYTATITSKRQLTIPVKAFREIGLKEGEKVLITPIDGKLLVEPMSFLLDSLAGSVKVPKEFKTADTDIIIRKAKKRYWQKRL